MNNSLRRHYIAIRSFAVRLQALDEQRRPMPRAVATGFVVANEHGPHLITCWHVATEFDIHDVKVGLALPRRRFLELTFLDVHHSGDGTGSFSGFRNTVVPLYQCLNPPLQPCWLQNDAHVPHADLNQIGLFVPSFHDIIILPLAADIAIPSVQFVGPEYWPNSLDDALAGEKCLVVGFPFGYGTHGETLAPVVLTRFIASATVPGRYEELFIDSIAAPGMSGAPVFVEREGKLTLLGAYTGAIYPEQAAARDQGIAAPTRDARDGRSLVTDLGTVVDLTRVVLGQYPMVRTPRREILHPGTQKGATHESSKL